MYPPHFEICELPAIQDAMEPCDLANLVTWTGEELVASPLPLVLVRDEGEYGSL
jgi:transcriptional regulator